MQPGFIFMRFWACNTVIAVVRWSNSGNHALMVGGEMLNDDESNPMLSGI